MASVPLQASSSSNSPALPSSGSIGRNPISFRLWKVIGSTSFDDLPSREALQTVSDYYAKPLDTPESEDRFQLGSEINGSGSSKAVTVAPAKGSDGELSTQKASAPVLNAAAIARKNFKKDLEWKLSEGSVRFLEAFGEVDKKLQVLRAHMQEMQTRCDQVQTQLEQANQGTKYLLERADGLRSQKASAQLRAQIADLLIARFTLTTSENLALTSREVPVGPELFKAMDRVIEIRKDCMSLFAFAGSAHDSVDGEPADDVALAGTEIMATTNEQLEAGYAKIYRWCQFEFRQFTKDTQLEVSKLMKDAVKRLRQRGDLLTSALQVLTSTRQSFLLQSFLDALTRGGPNGLPRPIELHAHDPTRYVGDMLAWVHQVTAGEREFLDALFGNISEARRMVGQPRDMNTTLEEDVLGRECLDKNLEGLCRPLRVRIQHTIKSQEGIILAYKISNLLQFYLITMKRTVGEEALLTQTLGEILQVANDAFFATLDAQGRSLLRFLHPPEADLSPPLALRDSAQILHEIMSVYDTSLVDEADRANDFSKILQAAVDPPLEMCTRMVDMRQKGGDWEKDIFLVNCLLYMLHILESYAFTQPQQDIIEASIQKHVDSITLEHHTRLLEQSGLATVMASIHEKPEDTPLSRMPNAESKAIAAAMKTFEAFLTPLDVLNSPSLTLLSSKKISVVIHRGALEGLRQAYQVIFDAVNDPENKYEFSSTLLTRGPDEVATLLGVAVAPE